MFELFVLCEYTLQSNIYTHKVKSLLIILILILNGPNLQSYRFMPNTKCEAKNPITPSWHVECRKMQILHILFVFCSFFLFFWGWSFSISKRIREDQLILNSSKVCYWQESELNWKFCTSLLICFHGESLIAMWYMSDEEGLKPVYVFFKSFKLLEKKVWKAI